jgi:glycosyltransferase involved in cell wall biosynthesis
MKIAHVIPVMTTVPPIKYGGIERIVETLATMQAQAGHQVTVFCAKESTLSGPNITLHEVAPFPTVKDLSQNKKYEIHEWIEIVAYQADFDIIHFHYEPIIGWFHIEGIEFNLLNYIHVPFINTFHNTTWIDKHIEYYKSHTELHPNTYVFISQRQREALSFLPHTQVIHNATDVASFQFNDKPQDYFAFLGRITPDKGIVQAIQIAKQSGQKLVIAAKVDPTDQEFYEKEVKDLIDGEQIKFIGEVDFAGKNELLRNAKALLFPIQWEEPFGLAVIEALACGTPVVALNRASIPEIITDKVTGIICNSVEEIISRLGEVDSIDRAKCRQAAEENFTNERMYAEYMACYEKVIANPKPATKPW